MFWMWDCAERQIKTAKRILPITTNLPFKTFVPDFQSGTNKRRMRWGYRYQAYMRVSNLSIALKITNDR